VVARREQYPDGQYRGEEAVADNPDREFEESRSTSAATQFGDVTAAENGEHNQHDADHGALDNAAAT
jgi:hypothetical protein